jgi:adenine phosphoribosyltransferase
MQGRLRRERVQVHVQEQVQVVEEELVMMRMEEGLAGRMEGRVRFGMQRTASDTLAKAVRDVPDFPKPGIIFKDITPILSDGELFKESIDLFIDACRPLKPDKIVGIDARGFLFASAVAYELGVGFVPVRKKGKLPYRTKEATYTLEYGEATIEMHVDAVKPGERIVLVDDLLATGGTSAAAAKLVAEAGGVLVEAQFLIELGFLSGRWTLAPTPVRAFLKY